MELVFTKGSGKFDLMEVFRAGAPAVRVDCPKQRIIPHDMVHYAVERTLKARGFLGRVQAGEATGFQMKPDDRSDSVERLVEVFQGDAWSGADGGASDIIGLYRVTCDARDCTPLPVDETSIQAVRATIAELTRRWDAIPVGESLVLAL
jgi:hypothetical protein